MWLKLTGSLYYFGNGGIISAKPISQYSNERVKGGYETELFQDGKITASFSVKETVEEIQELLNPPRPIRKRPIR